MISFGQLAALSKPSRTVAGFAAGSLLHTPWPVLVVLAVMAVCVEALRTIPQLLSTITPQRSGDRREVWTQWLKRVDRDSATAFHVLMVGDHLRPDTAPSNAGNYGGSVNKPDSANSSVDSMLIVL